MRTQVGIIGAGPAGLLLSRLLALQGIDSVVLENRSREYVEARIRAGILEQHTVDTLTAAGVGDRLQREGLEHRGIYLQYPGTRHKLDFPELCGRTVWVYGQTEVTKDLIKAQLDGGPPLLFEVSDVTPEDVVQQALRSLTRLTRTTVVEPGRLRRELAEVRRRRYARTSEEMSPGAASLAVPVQVERRSGPVVVAALGIVVPPHRRDLPRLVPVLEVAARGIGRELARTRDFH